MKIEPAEFFSVQQCIIGTCPVCKAFFRLSELRLIQKRGRKDFLDHMHEAERKPEDAEERLDAKEKELRLAARERGRAEAKRMIRKVDPIFSPRGLHAQDAQVLFQPVDFVVFSGLADTDSVRKIILLDRKVKDRQHRTIQRSLETCIGRGRYEWTTLRVSDAGVIQREE